MCEEALLYISRASFRSIETRHKMDTISPQSFHFCLILFTMNMITAYLPKAERLEAIEKAMELTKHHGCTGTHYLAK